ncbi:class I SAM-dependent methyltransferase [Rossellomorea sp. LjRoot5]|uniref:class I SAM-dependent methyltransferase n=1 Tax=Rossellomorea sp. LjRoot5 TaxID=3342331 RepID=UPI003ECD5439
MPIYNQIGKTYNTTRKADPRITQMILQQLKLEPSATILDIGAGTGNYSYELSDKGYHVIALEPSEIMRTQGRQHRNLTWKEGAAEQIPLEDASVDGIICTLASHHFHDLSLSFQEMRRVLKENGKIVIFTLDPRLCEDECWLFDYFGPVLKDAYRIHPPVKELSQLLAEQIERTVTMVPYPLPHDLVDQFFFTGWRTPERYLDRDFQQGTSPLAKGDEVNRCLEHLQNDLENGNWHENYQYVMNLEEYDCGHFFLVV